MALAEDLHELLLRTGWQKGSHLLLADSFLTHLVDVPFIAKISRKLAYSLREVDPDLVLVAEASGITVGTLVAQELGAKLLFARKRMPRSVRGTRIRAWALSYTFENRVSLSVSKEYLAASLRPVIVDDFLSTGSTALALARLAENAGTRIVGVGVIVNKDFLGGRLALETKGIPVFSVLDVAELETAFVQGRLQQ